MSAFTFRAVLAERAGFSKDRDGGTLRLEIAETDVPDMIGLLALTREVLVITVEVEPLPAVGGDTLRPIRKSRRLRAVQAEAG